ncbi:hypothetical protein JCM30237_21600 [Halolamina litorea]|uniref:Yip1 domain-containing protein n=1 Tax=Halolamina litorea TaxID=1515593 RepID=A0ABD6BP32_9EURY|nr:hypothetical protein [Halolamina litorea]
MQGQRTGLIDAIRIDVARLHATWMELLFPRQLNPSSVLGRWQPESGAQKVSYYGWAALGLPLVVIGYPLLLLGFATRYYAGKLDSATTRLGIVGVVGLAAVVWGLLTVGAWLRQFSTDGLIAVAAAGGVATVAAALAYVFSSRGGRLTSVLFAYPAAMTALFLPPVVAALYSPALAGVLTGSTNLAIWILDNVLTVGGLNQIIRDNFALRGPAYVAMWFGIAVPLGWLLGGVVALADVIRPKGDETSSRSGTPGQF